MERTLTTASFAIQYLKDHPHDDVCFVTKTNDMVYHSTSFLKPSDYSPSFENYCKERRNWNPLSCVRYPEEKVILTSIDDAYDHVKVILKEVRAAQ